MTVDISHSGYQNCKCCYEIIIVGDDRIPHLCHDCEDAGCEMTRDASGDLGYWDCVVHDCHESGCGEEFESHYSGA